MAVADKRLKERKELLFSRSDIETIETAAGFLALNASAFIRTSAIERAHQVLASEHVTKLNDENWKKFTRTVATYKVPNRYLKSKMKGFLQNYRGDI